MPAEALDESAVPVDVLEKAKLLAQACEVEQHGNRMQAWEEMPEWYRRHWIDKARRPD